MKNTDLIYQRLFVPEWDSFIDDFFQVALDELKRYSEEHGFAAWDGAEPEITEWGTFFEIDFKVPGFKPESVFAEAIENVVILSGMRWCRIPNENQEQLLFFRRVLEVPKRVDEESLRIYFRDECEVVLCVRELGTVTEGLLREAGLDAAKPVRPPLKPEGRQRALGRSGNGRLRQGSSPIGRRRTLAQRTRPG